MAKLRKVTRTIHTPDIPLLVSIILLLIFGIILVYDASVVVSHDVFGGKYHFLILQAIWVILGSLAALVVYRVGYQRWAKVSFPLLVISLLFLFLTVIARFLPTVFDTFIPEVYGARRWIIIPGRISFQPSELTKFGSILYFSAWLAKGDRSPIPFFFLLSLLAGLIIVQPDFGTAAILVAVVLSIYFVSGVSLFKLVPLVGFILAAGLAFIYSSPYRVERLQTYLNPSAADPLKSGYHIKQVLIALGSGGLAGQGFGESRQKYSYLPEVTTDSIFAVVGEEMGFVGASILVALFMFLIYRSFLVALRSKTKLGQLVAVGVASWLAVQIAVNLAAMTALVPLTGIPLPLISYGGSSMLFMMMGLGLLLSVSKEAQREPR